MRKRALLCILAFLLCLAPAALAEPEDETTGTQRNTDIYIKNEMKQTLYNVVEAVPVSDLQLLLAPLTEMWSVFFASAIHPSSHGEFR